MRSGFIRTTVGQYFTTVRCAVLSAIADPVVLVF